VCTAERSSLLKQTLAGAQLGLCSEIAFIPGATLASPRFGVARPPLVTDERLPCGPVRVSSVHAVHMGRLADDRARAESRRVRQGQQQPAARQALSSHALAPVATR
jgi:hypothetical protein